MLNNLIEPQAETIDSALSILKSYSEDTLDGSTITFVGDGTSIYTTQIKEAFSNAKFTDEKSNIISSISLGIAAFDKYSSGFEQNEVLPLYLKKPQAQRQLEEKLRNS